MSTSPAAPSNASHMQVEVQQPSRSTSVGTSSRQTAGTRDGSTMDPFLSSHRNITGARQTSSTRNGNTIMNASLSNQRNTTIKNVVDDECETCLNDDTCSVTSHRRGYTVEEEMAYICNNCEAVSLRHATAVTHHRKRSRSNECPQSHWPPRYKSGHTEYSKLRRRLNAERSSSKRTVQEHKKLRNQMMQRFILRDRECSRQQ